MKYFETKHERDSARITTLIGLLLLLVIFIVGPSFLDPPIEYGVAVNFGTTDYGSGNVQPQRPVRSEVKEVIKKPSVTESQPEASLPQETTEEVVTQETEESIAIKKKKEAEAKAAAEAKAEAKRIAREKKAQEEKKKKLDALIGGIGKSDGTDTGSEGNDNQAGDKGQLDGDPYAPSYFGEPGSVGGGVGYGLRGRGKPTKSKVIPECDEEGSVVVEIQVDRQGRVVNAVPGKRGTTGNICLYDAARKTALTYKWPADSRAPARQIGFVVINFSVSQ
jgi:outer membrane biosynthesis protein TonB